MHPMMTMKNGTHHLHDGMLSMWHHIDQHLHSRHFWAGAGVTLLIVAIAALLYMLLKNAPLDSYTIPYTFPYAPNY